MKRKGGPTEDDAGNGNHQSISHRKKNQKGNATGTPIEAAQDGSPLRVATTAEEEEDKTVRALLKKLGFDPNDLNKRNKFGWTPLTYFSSKGNVTMIRYLIARGAVCRKTDKDGWSPLYVAALYGYFEIIKLIYHHGGAHDDIRSVDNLGDSLLRIALRKEHFHVVYWFILKGALSSRHDDVAGGGIDDMVMRRDLRQEVYANWQDDKRLTVLSWARNAVATHDTVVELLLTGMIVRSNQTSSSLEVFKGTSGILELIAHYISGTPQQLRTLRQLIDRLPAFIADVPFVEEEEDVLYF